MTATTISMDPNSLQDPLSLTNQVSVALANYPGSGPHDLRVTTDSDSLIIEGRVESYFSKQMVQESLRGVAGCFQIDNRLDVVDGVFPG